MIKESPQEAKEQDIKELISKSVVYIIKKRIYKRKREVKIRLFI
jgi:hexokinase